MTRAEKVAEIVALREQGLTLQEAASRVGLSHSGARHALTDPDGSKQKALRARYSRPCARCGKPTDGSGGFKQQRTHCKVCQAILLHEGRRWTREAIIEAIQVWAQKNGRPPVAEDWRRSGGDDHPSLSNCYGPGRSFASWADAIEAAGFPRPVWHRWDRQTIIARIQRWAATHGQPPTCEDWLHVSDDNPSAGSVVHHFGSWAAGIEAAGFPRPLSRRHSKNFSAA